MISLLAIADVAIAVPQDNALAVLKRAGLRVDRYGSCPDLQRDTTVAPAFIAAAQRAIIDGTAVPADRDTAAFSPRNTFARRW